jgi:aquaporin Z
MGATAIGIIYSPWGQRSGAHFNPSVTLSFLRLGKVSGWDAAFYVAAQFAGGVGGVLLAASVIGMFVAHPSVNFAVTKPGPDGSLVAFVAELGISFLLFLVVLFTSNQRRTARYTGIFAGTMVALYITLESPISGMSMNPARTFGSALPAGEWTALWVYFTAPPIGMFAAAEIYRLVAGKARCAKLHHENSKRCIFRCEYAS